MPHQLPFECLSEIFKYLNAYALRSCLLVNRFWCKVSVPILWTSIRNYDTLIACLPNQSKEIFYKKQITFITSKPPPLFNYVVYIKYLNVSEIGSKIENLLKNNQSN